MFFIMTLQDKLTPDSNGNIGMHAADLATALALHAYSETNQDGFSRSELDANLGLDDAEKQQIDAIITEYHSKPTTLDKQEEPEFLTKEWFDKYFAAIVAGVVAVTMSATAVFVYREKTPDFQKPSKHIQKNNA